MGSRKDYIIDRIHKKGPAENEAIRSFFFDQYTGEEFRSPESSLIQTVSPLMEEDVNAFSFLEEAEYGYRLMIDPSKDIKNLLKSYYIPRTQPHVVSFLKEQSAYLYDLQGRWKEAITAYTYHGDRFINGLLRDTLNRYEFIVNSTENDEIHLEKKYTFINLINSVRNSGVCPFKYAIKERYSDLRKKLEKLSIMIIDDNPNYTSRTVSWIEVEKPWNFTFPPLSFNINDDEAFRKIMQSSWFNSVENITPLVKSLLADLIKVFIESPRPTQDITVYRGVKTAHNKVGPSTSDDFWSTSLNPYVSIGFSSYLGKNISFMLEEITIRKNVPCIFISQYSKVGQEEWEILLPPGVRYIVDNDIYIKTLPSDEELPYDTYTPIKFINYMSKKNPRNYFLVNTISAESFDINAPIIKDVFNAAKKRKHILNERRRMRHLGWSRTTRYQTPSLNRNNNRSHRRKQNTTRKQERKKKVFYIANEND